MSRSLYVQIPYRKWLELGAAFDSVVWSVGWFFFYYLISNYHYYGYVMRQFPRDESRCFLIFDLRPVSRAFFPKVTTTEIFNTTEESRQVCCHNLHSIAGWTVHQVEWGRGFTFGSSGQLIAAWLGRKQKVSVNRSRWAFFVTHKISGKNHVSHNWCHHVPICYSIETSHTLTLRSVLKGCEAFEQEWG